MNRKQNSLMRFSRTERLAQLSEQEIVIERKKKEILAKIEAQKKKQTEEAFKKLESSKESKNNKLGFAKKSWSGNAHQENKKKETIVEPVKENLTNAFSNDGSFLDQFKKLSKSGLSSDNVYLRTATLAKKNYENHEADDRHFVNQSVGNKTDFYKDSDKNIERNQKSDNSSDQSSNSEVQPQLPPHAFVKSASQHQQGVDNPVSLSPHSSQSIPNQFNSELNSPYSNYPGTVKSVHNIQTPDGKYSSVFEFIKQDESLSHDLVSGTSLSSPQPSLSIIPKHNPPPLSMQVQNVPPPPIPIKNKELPKYRTEGISLYLKPQTTKKLEIIPNPLEIDQPPSLKKPTLSFPEKNKNLNPTQNLSSTPISKFVSSDTGNLVSSAFYDNEDEEDIGNLNEKWAQLVARCGDEFEDSLRERHQNDPSLRFLFEKNSKEYLSYRKLVLKYRRSQNVSDCEFSPEAEKKSLEEETGDKICSRSDDRNLPQTKETCDTGSWHLRNSSTSENSTLNELKETKKHCSQIHNEEIDNKYIHLISTEQNCPEEQSSNKDLIEKDSRESEMEVSDQTKSEERRKRKRKSRWGDVVATASTSATTGNINMQAVGKLPQPKSTLLSQLTRSDPGLIQYARQTFGSTNLSEEDWKKAEDHYKINLLYQDMVKKRAEVEKLEKQGKFKYEYDSDEDTEGGTWEHKLRQQEMQATQLWAEELTRQAAGKHHIGDFLPPEELERFMEKYNAVKEGREPDLSDYKEYKLKEDNVGYRLLQKMGWNEGQGLGQDGSGIQNPVNKATTRHENQGLGVERPDGLEAGDDEYDAYRKRMMLAYRFRPNPLNNPRRPYY